MQHAINESENKVKSSRRSSRSMLESIVATAKVFSST